MILMYQSCDLLLKLYSSDILSQMAMCISNMIIFTCENCIKSGSHRTQFLSWCYIIKPNEWYEEAMIKVQVLHLIDIWNIDI